MLVGQVIVEPSEALGVLESIVRPDIRG